MSRVLVKSGQVFDVRDVVLDHPNQRGSTTELRLVRSHCADCGEPFCFWVTEYNLGREEFNRRCARHRKPVRRVRKVHPLAVEYA